MHAGEKKAKVFQDVLTQMQRKCLQETKERFGEDDYFTCYKRCTYNYNEEDEALTEYLFKKLFGFRDHVAKREDVNPTFLCEYTALH